MTARVFVHMGNPKAFSTSLQRMLSEKESDHYRYLGFRPSRPWQEWYEDPWQSELLNFHLRVTSTARFEEKAAYFRDCLREEIAQAGYQSKDLWISSENLSMRFTLADIDVEEKFRRLQGLLPEGTTYFVVFRNVYRALRSIYSEYLKQGYAHSFRGFCDEVYVYRSANFLDSLCPGSLLERLSRIKRPENRLVWIIGGESDSVGMRLASDTFGLACGESFANLPHLNSSSGAQDDAELLCKNRLEPDKPSSTGLLEPHRLLWHLSEQEKARFDRLVWADLRGRQERRVQSLAGTRDLSGEAVTGPLRDYLSELEVLDRIKMAELAPENMGQRYSLLWKKPS